MQNLIILKQILSDKIYHLPALKIIFNNYPVKSKITVFKEYLKHCGRKTFNEVISILELDDFDKTIMTKVIIDKKSYKNIEISNNINERTARRFIDKLIDDLIAII